MSDINRVLVGILRHLDRWGHGPSVELSMLNNGQYRARCDRFGHGEGKTIREAIISMGQHQVMELKADICRQTAIINELAKITK